MRDSAILAAPYGECDPGNRDEPKIECSGCGATINISESTEHGESRLCESCEAELKETFGKIDDMSEELAFIFFKEFAESYKGELK